MFYDFDNLLFNVVVLDQAVSLFYEWRIAILNVVSYIFIVDQISS